MARKVTNDDIRLMNEIYYKCHNYAETGRQTGWSGSTVKRYIDPNFTPVIETDIRRFDIDKDLPADFGAQFSNIENWGELCVLSDDEIVEMTQLWKEIAV